MYAIVKTGGKQYRVEKGQTLLVERLRADEGATVAARADARALRRRPSFGDALGKATVSAKVLGHERGPKLRVFKFKPKRGYKKLAGHRQELTRIEITDIAPAPRAAKKPAAQGGDRVMAHKKGLGSSRNGRDSERPAPRRQGLRRPVRHRRRDHRPPARHALPARARASASARTTRCSPRPPAPCEFTTRRRGRVVNVVPDGDAAA